jgi:hypothetical protein
VVTEAPVVVSALVAVVVTSASTDSVEVTASFFSKVGTLNLNSCKTNNMCQPHLKSFFTFSQVKFKQISTLKELKHYLLSLA